MSNSPFTKVVANEIVGGIPGRKNPVPVDQSAFAKPAPTSFPMCKCGRVALKNEDECGKCKAIRVHKEKLETEAKMKTELELAGIKDRMKNLEFQVASLSLLAQRLENLEKSLGIGESAATEGPAPVAAGAGKGNKNKAPSLD